MYFLKRVCSYCKEGMGVTPTPIEPKPGYDVSHGICADCLLKHHPEIANSKLMKGGNQDE